MKWKDQTINCQQQNECHNNAELLHCNSVDQTPGRLIADNVMLGITKYGNKV